ncbi:hypothetical protein [Sulfuriflexus mobilis]|uniref:hypothetical protein n=1 Tax=Sulfuriflexus mobilis TaxID=1811807 RepID=UPI000F833200|nr:hypothetical protein [Sulfuriflexus mobilis]
MNKPFRIITGIDICLKPMSHTWKTSLGSSMMAALALYILIAVLLATNAQADIYRGMRINDADQPQVANTALGLGVRDADVVLQDDIVLPNNPDTDAPQGTSVVTANPCELPGFTRPAGNNWNGTGSATVRVWVMDEVAHLPGTAQVQAAAIEDSPNHAVISTAGVGQTLANFRVIVGSTQAHWAVVPPPDEACP